MRWAIFVVGLMFFSLGISVTINVQHLGIHPWDVLNVGLYEKYGFTIGTWNIVCGIILVIISYILDKRYIKLGTFLNALLVGSFVDLFLWLDFLPGAAHTWVDVVILLIGIIFMGFGGGMYNAAGVGSGPRDGFMLSISDKTGFPIRRVRIVTETSVLLIGLLLGGPVFIFTFLFTFIQSPLFQYFFLKISALLNHMEKPSDENKKAKSAG
ncbi:YczE/YyaS/YitT family protein [Virgibacillus phasianinus]